MSGETEKAPSGWTVDTLLAYVDRILQERDERYRELIRAVERSMEQGFIEKEKAVNAALTAAKEAVAKAETAAEKRFDNQNEFRAQLADQATLFIPRREAEQGQQRNAEKIEATDRRVAEVTALFSARLDKLDGRSAGINSSVGFVFATIAAGAAIIGVVVSLTVIIAR